MLKISNTIIILILAFMPLNAQTNKESNQWLTDEVLNNHHLLDLRDNKNEDIVRIWMGLQVLEINFSNPKKTKIINKIANSNSKKRYTTISKLDSVQTKLLIDTLLTTRIFSLESDGKMGVSGRTYFFEISKKDKYRTYKFWMPRESVGGDSKECRFILNTIDYKFRLHENWKNILYTLPPGQYWDFYTGFIDIDCLPEKEDRNGKHYSQIINLIKENNIAIDNLKPWEFPVIFKSNGEKIYFKDLPNTKLKRIKKITFFKAENPATSTLFGSSGENGVIYIECK